MPKRNKFFDQRQNRYELKRAKEVTALTKRYSQSYKYKNQNEIDFAILKFCSVSQKILALMLLSAACCALIPNHPPEYHTSLHDLSVNDLSNSQALCTMKQMGERWGQICVLNETRFFMKTIWPHPHQFEVFNRYWVKEHVGLNVPESYIFHEFIPNSFFPGKTQYYYLGTKEVVGFTHAVDFTPEQKLIVQRRYLPRIAVAMSFINDLHFKNWGMNNRQEVILLDVDSANQIAKDLDDYVKKFHRMFTYLQEHGYELTPVHLQEMLALYQKMKAKTLPKYNERFYLSKDMYHIILDTFISRVEEILNNIPAISKRPTM